VARGGMGVVYKATAMLLSLAALAAGNRLWTELWLLLALAAVVASSRLLPRLPKGR